MHKAERKKADKAERKKAERKLLSDLGMKAVAKRPVTGKQHMIWDTLNPHFGVRVSAGGKLAFVVMRRPAGGKQPIRVTLGHYPALTLEKAREAAATALTELLAGKKPTEERRER